ncbi:ABC transporter substrate-binding protein [Microvirga puerhi]|uniref:ABC transporter substrate-binding protein n=1 Tax=Microvirga puerhi TaxID=2876078 RepID=A0ABS7VLK4_9HYPH|nr:ABC transporter substrate-binding protein [Microvirga puerhi]MBZ6075892.1 ABC transporter substrate-binding protein [Microvirga puerhi]
MIRSLERLAGCAAIILAATATISSPKASEYPADYAQLVAAAEKEGKVSIYAPTDPAQSKALMDAFNAKHPKIKVEWNDITAQALFSRIISEAAAGQVGGDIAWNVPDMQLKLVSMGHAVPYESPEAATVPEWGKYKGIAYATTIEPAVIMYNKTLTSEDKIPKTHDQLLDTLKNNAEAWRGKVATFDPEKSGTGFLWSRNNERLWPDFWTFVKEFGKVGGQVYSSSSQFKEKVLSGELLMAFDMNGAYAREWAKAAPNLGVIAFNDYTQAYSRVAFIIKDGKNPNAARVFLDFMLSQEGQRAVSNAGLPSVRRDVDNGNDIDDINALSNGKLKPIALGQDLIDDFDPKTRTTFLARWKRELGK